MEKIAKFRELTGQDHPLIVGAGSTPETVKEEMQYANGVIIGSFFKEDFPYGFPKTMNSLSRGKIIVYVQAFNEATNS